MLEKRNLDSPSNTVFIPIWDVTDGVFP